MKPRELCKPHLTRACGASIVTSWGRTQDPRADSFTCMPWPIGIRPWSHVSSGEVLLAQGAANGTCLPTYRSCTRAHALALNAVRAVRRTTGRTRSRTRTSARARGCLRWSRSVTSTSPSSWTARSPRRARCCCAGRPRTSSTRCGWQQHSCYQQSYDANGNCWLRKHPLSADGRVRRGVQLPACWPIPASQRSAAHLLAP